MKEFVHTRFFENSIMLCVILNTVILSLDGMISGQKGNFNILLKFFSHPT